MKDCEIFITRLGSGFGKLYCNPDQSFGSIYSLFEGCGGSDCPG
jgi:hypothetical protein